MDKDRIEVHLTQEEYQLIRDMFFEYCKPHIKEIVKIICHNYIVTSKEANDWMIKTEAAFAKLTDPIGTKSIVEVTVDV